MAVLHLTVKSVTKTGATLAAKAGDVVTPDGWAKDADATHRDDGIKSAELSLTFAGDHDLAKGQVVTVEADLHAPAEVPDEPEAAPEPAPKPAKKTAAKRPAKKAAKRPAKKATAKRVASGSARAR